MNIISELNTHLQPQANSLPHGDFNDLVSTIGTQKQIDNLLSTIENQKQTISSLIHALEEISDSLLDCADRSEDSSDLLDIARKVTKILAAIASSNYFTKDKEINR